MKQLVLFLLGFGAGSSLLMSEVVPGSLPGSIEVDNYGSAHYAIPIEVTPGVVGMEPNLSLVYNSQSGENYLGVGWSLTGISSISRIPSNTYLETDWTGRNNFDPLDFHNIGMDLTSSDRFAYNGQRLVVVSGNYGSNNAEYRTEMEQFDRIRSHGSAGGGPQHFVVETRDGLKKTFGGTDDSRLLQNGVVRVWMLSQIEDVNGNRIQFSYTQNAAKGEIYPDEITYTIHGTSNSGGKVDFVFEDKPASTVYPLYHKGAKIEASKRLKEIRILDKGQLARRYELEYSVNSNTHRNRLASVQLHAGGKSLPATTFGYQNVSGHTLLTTNSTPHSLGAWLGTGNSPTTYRSADITGDGQGELLRYTLASGGWQVITYKYDYDATLSREGLTLQQLFSYPVGAPAAQVVEGDFDGDGKMDLATITVTGSPVHGSGMTLWIEQIRVHLSTGSGFVQSPQVATNHIMLPNSVQPNPRLVTLDYNGDGLSDLVVLRNGTASSLWQSTFDAQDAHQLVKVQDISLSHAGWTTLVADLDGDGNEDLIQYGRTFMGTDVMAVRTYRSNGSTGFSTVAQQSFGPWHDDSRILPLDMNGDGLTDLVYTYRSGSTIHIRPYLGTGSLNANHFLATNNNESFTATSNWEHVHLFGVESNGDGRADLQVVYRNGSSQTRARSYTSRGDQFDYRGDVSLGLSWGTSMEPQVVPLDIDADGFTDLAIVYPAGSTANVRHWFMPGNYPDLLNLISNGWGSPTAISYLPGTHPSVYAQTLPSVWPEVRAPLPIPLVQWVGVDDGLGAPAPAYQSFYRYEDGLRHALGYGFLGYRGLISYDYNQDLWKLDLVFQSFPYIGLPQATGLYAPHPSGSGATARIWSVSDVIAFEMPIEGRTYFPYIAKAIHREHEVSYSAPSTNYVKTRVTEKEYDEDWGNLTTHRLIWFETSSAGSNIWQGALTTNNTYLATDETLWRIGKVSGRQIIHQRPSENTVVRHLAFEYDGLGRLEAEILEPNGGNHRKHTTGYEYDNRGNITKVHSIAHNGSSLQTRTATLTYSSDKRFLISSENPLQHTIIREYDHLGTGLVTRETDPNGLITEYQYDPFGKPKKVTYPDGTWRSWLYQGGGTLMGPVPAGGRSYAYAVTAYTQFENSASEVQNLAPYTTTYFDRKGRQVRFRDQLNTATGLTYSHQDTLYNSIGQVAATSAPFFAGDQLHWTFFSCDPLGRVIEERRQREGAPDQVQLIEYRGNEIWTYEDALGANLLTRTRLNLFDEVTEVIDPMGTVLRKFYTAHGHLRQTQNVDNGNAQTLNLITYDNLGRRTSLQNLGISTRVQEYAYNGFGELIIEQEKSGSTVHVDKAYTYDALGRMIGKEITEGSHSYNYEYIFDRPNNVSYQKYGMPARELQDGVITREYRYDSLSRLEFLRERVNGELLTSRSFYDQGGRLSRSRYPTGFEARYTYDTAGGFLSEIVDSNSRVWWSAPRWTASGQLSEFSLEVLSLGNPNNYTVQRSYEKGSGYLVDSKVYLSNANQPVFHHQYQWDNRGNLTRRTDRAHRNGSLRNLVERFAYDDLNRLTGSRLGTSGAIPLHTSYDRYGNLTAKPGTENYYYSDSTRFMRLQSGSMGSEGTFFNYNARGELTLKISPVLNYQRSISWTPFGQPSSISTNSGVSYSYTYDAHHRMIREVHSDGTDRRLFKGGLYERVRRTGQPIQHRHYIPLPGGVTGYLVTEGSQSLSLGDESYLLSDHLGSSTVVLNRSGSNNGLVEEYSYDAWGTPRNPVNWATYGVQSPWPDYHGGKGYGGHDMLREASMVHMKGRIYDPQIGRFLSPDPFVQSPDFLQCYNRYSYVWNNPLRYVDPSGFTVEKPQGPMHVEGRGNTNDNIIIRTARELWNWVAGQPREGHNSAPQLPSPNDIHTLDAFHVRGNADAFTTRDAMQRAIGNQDLFVIAQRERDGTTSVVIGVRLHFHSGGRPMSADDARIKRWVEGILDNWSGEKGEYDVTVGIFVSQTPRNAVRVQVGPGSDRALHGFWPSGTSAWAAAHEFGHILNLPDIRKNAPLSLQDQIYYKQRESSIMWDYRYDRVASNPFNRASEWDVAWVIEKNR